MISSNTDSICIKWGQIRNTFFLTSIYYIYRIYDSKHFSLLVCSARPCLRQTDIRCGTSFRGFSV